MHHSTILTVKNPNKMQQCIKMLLFLILNEAQYVSGDTPPIIRSLKLHKQPLVLHTWKVVRHAVVGHCQVAYATWQRPTTAVLCVNGTPVKIPEDFCMTVLVPSSMSILEQFSLDCVLYIIFCSLKIGQKHTK